MTSHSDSSDPNAETVISGSSVGQGGARPPADFPTVTGYDLIRQLHHGGQGVVFQAQQQGTRRAVAIKFMHAHAVGSESEKARFEREVQILGQLRHPSIVSIHDSGMARGSFYYVMDYIDGHPLDLYLAQAKLDVHARIELFAAICDAVHAAHLAGVIHRDLKPNNILVDKDGKPHVLDFGLAKVELDETSDLTAAPVMTMTGQFFGSLPWASPEQAEAVPSKIDMRSDVYSLGVILYQLLTDRFPYEVTGNMRDTMENILHAEPTPPRQIADDVDDELETITLKCLSKERDRRYQIAGELARDIRHYLAGEPIEAKRDSGWYVLRKTLRRYRVPVLVSCAFLVLLVASLVFSLTAWRNAADERDRAISAEKQRNEALDMAEKQATLAKLRAAEATRYLHAIQVGSALAALEEHDWITAERLLRETAQRAVDGIDLRSFAWRHVAHRLRGQTEATTPTPIGRLPKGEDVLLSPSGTHLLSWTNRRLRLHDDRGRVLRTIAMSRPVQAVGFSPDGSRLVVGLPRAMLSAQLANLLDQKAEPTFRRVPLTVTPTAVAIDNSGMLAYGTEEGQVAIDRGAIFGLARDLLGRGIEACQEEHTSPIQSLSFQSDQGLLAAVSWSRRGTLSGVFGAGGGVEVKVWRIPSLTEAIPVSVTDLDVQSRIPPPDLLLSLRPETKLTEVAFSPDAPILAAWGGSFVRVWSLRLIEQTAASGELDMIAEASPLQVYAAERSTDADPSEIPGTSAAWSPGGEQLICGNRLGKLQLFDVTRHPNASTELHEVFRGKCEEEDAVSGLAFAGQMPAAVVLGEAGIRQWNLTSALPHIELPGRWDALHFDAIGQIWTMLRGSGGNEPTQLLPEVGRVSAWNLATSESLWNEPLPSPGQNLVLADNGVWVPMESAELLHVATAQSGSRRVGTRPGTTSWIGPDGKILLAMRAAGESWKDLRLLAPGKDKLRAVDWKAPRTLRDPQFSLDGGWVMGSSDDGATGMVLPTNGRPSVTIAPEGSDQVRILAGHTLRDRALVATRNGTQQFLSLHGVRGKQVTPLTDLPGDATLAGGVFSLNGAWVAVAVLDATRGLRLMVWDVATARLTLDGSLPRELLDQSPREWCAFAPDEELLALPGAGHLRLIDLRNGQERMRLRVEELPRQLRFAPDGSALAAILDGGQARIWLAQDPQPSAATQSAEQASSSDQMEYTGTPAPEVRGL